MNQVIKYTKFYPIFHQPEIMPTAHLEEHADDGEHGQAAVGQPERAARKVEGLTMGPQVNVCWFFNSMKTISA